MDLLSNPIIILVLALLGIPAFTSGITGILNALQEATGVPSRVWVYLASLGVTGVLVLSGAVALPVSSPEPELAVGAWLVWATANAELARRIYELLEARLYYSEPA